MFPTFFAQPSGPNDVNPKGAPGAAGSADPNAPEDEEQTEEVAAGVAAVMSDLAPWGISILLHAALVLIAFFIVWTTIRQIENEDIIIPDARLSTNPGAPLTTRTLEKVQQPSEARKNVTKTNEQTTQVNKTNNQTQLVGVMGGAAGKANPFGAGVGNDGPFKSNFYGAGGNARKIVYVVDASGSLIDTLPFVLIELKRSITELKEEQSFTVIFFSGKQPVVESPPVGLKPATVQNKQRVIAWLDPRQDNVPMGGRTDPIPALKRALQHKPQLIYLLSDNITAAGQGKYELFQAQLLSDVKNANAGATKINTIQFLYPDPLEKIGLKSTLREISDQSGGIYKYVDARELGL